MEQAQKLEIEKAEIFVHDPSLGRPRVLIVDDEETTQLILQTHLEKNGFHATLASTAEEMNQYLQENDFDLVLLDLQLPDGDGIELIRPVQDSIPNVPVIIITAHGSVERVVEAMRNGAYDFVSKPIDFNRLSAILKNALERNRLKRKAESFERTRRTGLCDLIGGSPEIQVVYHIIETIAPTKASVFIVGESGTGKELIARAIHQLSDRRNHNMVDVNCAAIPKDLLESELFGHEKSAFTGANQRMIGRCEQAHLGTLFLDEIAEMDMNLQPKLLRFLQERFLYRVGGKTRIDVDTRVISATNRNPMEAVKDGILREDLYYRLNVVQIDVPPLRERVEDIPDLAQFFLEKFARENGKEFHEISSSAEDAMCSYRWPGNVRELENVIQQVVILNQGPMLEANMLPETLGGTSLQASITADFRSQSPASTPINESPSAYSTKPSNEIISLEDMEKHAIDNALRIMEGNVSKAATALKVSQATLYRKIRDFGFVPKQYKFK